MGQSRSGSPGALFGRRARSFWASLTFMQRAAGQGLELGEVVNQVAVLVFGLRGHVVELLDVALPDAQGEDLHAALPQGRRDWSRVAAVGVAVGDQEDDLAGVGSGVTQDLLPGETNTHKKKHLYRLFLSQIGLPYFLEGT